MQSWSAANVNIRRRTYNITHKIRQLLPDFDADLEIGLGRASQFQVVDDLLAIERRLARQIDFDDGDSFFSDVRVAVGFGFRIKIPIFGQQPIALDFGFPISTQSGDDKQILSFSIARDF